MRTIFALAILAVVTASQGRHWLECGASHQLDKCATAFAPVDTELHETRCCRTGGTKENGWEKAKAGSDANKKWCSDNDVWGFSKNGGDAECNNGNGKYPGLTFEDAEAFCAAEGGRLCTREEVQKDCTRGTGCSHDSDLIWTSDVPAPDEGQPAWDATTNMPIAGGMYYVARGSTDGNWDAAPATQDEIHEARCCRDGASTLATDDALWYLAKGGSSTNKAWCTAQNVWGMSKTADDDSTCNNGLGKNTGMKFADAKAWCESFDNGRLCTLEELEKDCTRGTGCSHDNDHIWSSTPYGFDPQCYKEASCQGTGYSVAANNMGCTADYCNGLNADNVIKTWDDKAQWLEGSYSHKSTGGYNGGNPTWIEGSAGYCYPVTTEDITDTSHVAYGHDYLFANHGDQNGDITECAWTSPYMNIDMTPHGVTGMDVRVRYQESGSKTSDHVLEVEIQACTGKDGNGNCAPWQTAHQTAGDTITSATWHNADVDTQFSMYNMQHRSYRIRVSTNAQGFNQIYRITKVEAFAHQCASPTATLGGYLNSCSDRTPCSVTCEIDTDDTILVTHDTTSQQTDGHTSHRCYIDESYSCICMCQ